ncbi:dr1-associated corepressor homolog isoform X3 [Oreochromis niloticus]|uniref:dr1-associated corepressor homolog isoform X3 n=1 Tax=Oreochromis niloticus TaxID=8128 RepID=UPI00090540E0|nr:dr1-associated corepressor homolog isoform X3 [Oreochromis niloticus]XP_039459598.1 dr1-associated corepressor homolog isoform X3 [Oreochromis aureus]
MDEAAICGKNMKNVFERRGLKRRKCPDRREDITYASLLRIKKIMQKDTEVGRMAMAVPVIISRALEIFLKSLLTKTCVITESKLSTVVSVAHILGSTNHAYNPEGQQRHENKQHEVSVKKPPEVEEMAPQGSLDSLDNDSSASESELYICL